MDYLLVGVGGLLGANARYIAGRLIAERLGTAFPWHTLIVNVSGSLIIGVVMVLLTERWVADPAWRLLLVVGFLGGYTTFSSYTYEALMLAERGEWLAGAWYAVGSNGLALLATFLGIALTRAATR